MLLDLTILLQFIFRHLNSNVPHKQTGTSGQCTTGLCGLGLLLLLKTLVITSLLPGNKLHSLQLKWIHFCHIIQQLLFQKPIFFFGFWVGFVFPTAYCMTNSTSGQMYFRCFLPIFPVDNDTMASHSAVSIRILDVNDNPPELATPYEASICEDAKPGQVCLWLSHSKNLLMNSFAIVPDGDDDDGGGTWIGWLVI